MRRCAVALLFGAVVLEAQIDPRDILVNARHRIIESLDRLPKYMCTETVDRSRYTTDIRRHLAACDEPAQKREKTLQTSDRLRLDVTITPTREMYAWHGAQEFDDRDLLDIVNDGAISTGEFGGHIANLFGSDIANFTYNGDRTDEKARVVAEFGYSVPKERSRYEMGGKNYRTMTAYDGTVLIDAKTFEVLQIVIHTARLPEETGACYSTSTLNLGRVPINGYDLLLPSEAHFEVVMLNGSENRNRVAYSACHEFHADSELTFDDALPVSGPSPKPPARPLPVPPLDLAAGTPFRLKLSQTIDPSIAAAGDPVDFTLSAPLKTESGLVIPVGTAVHGRIMRVQHDFGTRSSVIVTTRLETIDAMGKVRPFAGQGELPVQRFNAGAVSFTRQRVELGSLDSMETRDTAQLTELSPKRDFIFRPGTEMKWLTMRPRTAAAEKP